MGSRPPFFARGGFTNPFGKLTELPIKGLRIPIQVDEALQREAKEIRVPYHEFLREVLTVRAMGREVVKATFAKRIDAIAGSVEETKQQE